MVLSVLQKQRHRSAVQLLLFSHDVAHMSQYCVSDNSIFGGKDLEELMEMYRMEKFLQREDSDVSVASNGIHLLKVTYICVVLCFQQRA